MTTKSPLWSADFLRSLNAGTPIKPFVRVISARKFSGSMNILLLAANGAHVFRGWPVLLEPYLTGWLAANVQDPTLKWSNVSST